MSEEEINQTRIRELEDEIAEKDNEIIEYLYKLEQLDANITQLEQLVPEESDKKKSKKQQVADSKITLKLKEKDELNRDLKDRMGFLRKENVRLQQELDKIKRELNNLKNGTSVIRVEDLRKQTPLNVLVKDLQDMVNKQKSELNQLQFKIKKAEEFNEKVKEYESIIETYKSEINELNQKMTELSTSSDSESGDSMAKNLIEDLQTQLNKSKMEIIELKQKLSKKSKKTEKKSETREFNKLEDQIKEFKELLDIKNLEIESLKKDLLTKVDTPAISAQSDEVSSEMMKTLKEDLQNQLNKSKLQVRSLQEQINKYKSGEISGTGESEEDLDGKLKMQREMAIFLQKQLKTKEEEMETIKNEAVQIKKRYRQLENHLNLRDQKLNDMQKQIEGQIIQTPTQRQEDPHVSLRMRELKGIVQDLEKKNVEQRLEIAQLRKK
ncbi:MAG: hypothetical protein KGD65_14460 [Candidatus Lokiarchaeota archaeon]|nr:hypothetical protein [Candidatus Lokiarchaeota archaeon]